MLAETMVSRRRLLAAALPGVGLLAACGGLPAVANPFAAATATPSPPRRLRVVISSLDNARPFLEVAIGRVPESRRLQFDVVGLTPVRTETGLLGNVQTIPRDFTVWPPYHAAALAAMTDEAAPDLLAVDSRWIAVLGRTDLLRDLAPILNGVGWFKAEEYVSNALEAGRVRGKQLALPMATYMDAMLYDARAFADAGVRPPRPDWRWPDLLDAARALTRPGRWGIQVSDWGPQLWTAAWQWGADVVSRDGARLELREPGTIGALAYMADLVHRHKVAMPVDASTASGYLAAMALREVAMSGGGFGGAAWWRTPRTETFHVVPWPAADRRVAYAWSPLMLGIARGTRQPDLALEGLGALAEAARQTMLLPVRQGWPDLKSINLVLSAEDVAGMESALGAARFLPGDMPYFRVATAVARELTLPVLTGEKRPAQAANDAQAVVDKLLAEFEQRG
jgi:ABC-type glycerol-3-phosphate transport system substrate-binding protein